MNRLAWGVGVLSVVTVGALSTASNSLPSSSTAGYTSVSVTGATVRSVDYTVTANAITGFTMQLDGSQVLKTATAAFDGSAPGTCVMGVYDLINNQTPITCTGFSQQADRSWRLVVTVS